MDSLKKEKQALINKLFLVIVDALSVALCSFLGLLMRFEMDVSHIPVPYMMAVERMVPAFIVITLLIFWAAKLYHTLWRFANSRELVGIVAAVAGSTIFTIIYSYFTYNAVPRSFFAIYFICLLICVCFTRYSTIIIRTLIESRNHGRHARNTMIIGAGEAGNMVMKELIMSNYLDARIKCFIDDDKHKQNNYIHGVKVVGGRDKIIESVKKYDINEIIIAMPSIGKKTTKEIVDICKDTNCDLKILPGVYQFVTGDLDLSMIRNVQIEDLLGRETVDVDVQSIMSYVSKKCILVTGGGGSIGSELCRQIAANHPRRLIILDIYENNAYDIQQELKQKYPHLDLIVLIGSVRNTNRVNSIFEQYRPEIVYHAAAHKHVPLMEDSPNEAIKNNVFGTYKVATAADRYGAKRFVLISTDKAVNPTNIMGASKRMCEMIVQSFNNRSDTDFVAVRFGNVLGSNGSVIPLFKKQIEAGGPVTVTHPDVVRYFMTIPEAVSLVLEAGATAKGGEIFVLDMGEPVRIDDLARNLIRLSGYTVGEDIEIEYTGLRPGEKLFEELLMNEEGLQQTANKMIYVGKPIEFDEDEFLRNLEKLYTYAYDETDQMKAMISKIVPTYHIRPEDKKRDALKLKRMVSVGDSEVSQYEPFRQSKTLKRDET
ncbi:polysaccharide biosynthesis protein [Frisingicoccus caecimuris]|uniref:FlaA1/EpsC-like NDP-sugar epimerase n=1 Tax=Frisingicoccus caecimuris TaxID=1796636 RepID=A0A4R2LEZ8_9FIRM|nr:nucleoside-diphosphate sugar epimerase/dehydratase [Frisingicoccus caecimuris]MCR1918799.1 polysaccharide biosynthesis protein [Frisingicoccus caecimuris]TCO84426.1 FlaA1/EpsC-like NDP-sugar epimerase [Frisingicoccus caecimuris]